MARSVLNTKIKAAIALLQQYDGTITPEAVRVNLDVGWDDAQGVVEGSIMAAIRTQLKAEGLIIADRDTGERKEFWDARIPDLEEQLRIKKESNRYDANRIKADKAVLAFLAEKEKEFGYEVYPGLFAPDINRIYSMHNLTAPRRIDVAA